MKKFILLTLASLSLAACSTSAEPLTTSLLWKVTGDGLEAPSFLLGTHHFAPLSTLDAYPGYADAITSVTQVVGELEMTGMAQAQTLMMQAGAMPEGVTYHDLLTGEQYARLDEKLRGFFGAGLEQFGRFKPAMILNMYVAVAYMQAHPEFNPIAHVPIDTHVQNLAVEQGKEIVGLESPEEQIQLLFNYEPLDVQAALLLCSLENDESMVGDLQRLDELYIAGDLDGMYDFAFNNADDPCPSSEQFNLQINKIRNDKWLARIPGIMAEGPAFIAVGGLHLAGEEGLINRLRGMGYTVEPIK